MNKISDVSWLNMQRESNEFYGLYPETRKDMAEEIINIARRLPVGWNINTSKKEYTALCKDYLRNEYNRRRPKGDVKGFIPGFIFTMLLNWVINWVINKMIDSIWEKS